MEPAVTRMTVRTGDDRGLGLLVDTGKVGMARWDVGVCLRSGSFQSSSYEVVGLLGFRIAYMKFNLKVCRVGQGVIGEELIRVATRGLVFVLFYFRIERSRRELVCRIFPQKATTQFYARLLVHLTERLNIFCRRTVFRP